MPARLPLPSWLSPRTVRSYSVLCFYFFSRRRKEKTTTNTTYVYTWICLLSDECFVSLWYIPHFTLCTPLNKVYEFIAVYRGAVKAAVVDSVTEHTWSEKHFLVLPVACLWHDTSYSVKKLTKNPNGKITILCATKFLILKGTKYNRMYLYHVDYYSIYCDD